MLRAQDACRLPAPPEHRRPPAPPTATPQAAAAAGTEDREPRLDGRRPLLLQPFGGRITHPDHAGVPRPTDHAARATRRSRAVSRPRSGWQSTAGHRAMLVALQGFDTS